MGNVFQFIFLCKIKHCNQLSVNKQTKPVGINVWNRVIEWMVFNANSTIFQLYHGKNKLIFNEMMDQHAELDFYSARSLKQQSADRYVAPLGHINLIPSKQVFAISP